MFKNIEKVIISLTCRLKYRFSCAGTHSEKSTKWYRSMWTWSQLEILIILLHLITHWCELIRFIDHFVFVFSEGLGTTNCIFVILCGSRDLWACGCLHCLRFLWIVTATFILAIMQFIWCLRFCSFWNCCTDRSNFSQLARESNILFYRWALLLSFSGCSMRCPSLILEDRRKMSFLHRFPQPCSIQRDRFVEA